MKIKGVLTVSNALWLAVISCVAVGWHHEYSQMRRYQPTVDAFAPKQTWSGVFTYYDGGKSLQGSWIDGRPVFVAANYEGATTGFGRSFGINSGAQVTATVAQIKTASGTVWIAESIQDANRLFVSRSPREMYELWSAESHQMLFLRCLFILVGIVSPYLVVTGIIEAVRSGAFKRTPASSRTT
jgi:hypothetical protein